MVRMEKKFYFRYENDYGQVRENIIEFEGVFAILNVDIERQLLIIFVSKWKNIWLQQPCPTCKGYRLKQGSIGC